MMTLQHKFVEFIPEVLEENMLYVSFEYCTAIHKCVCGCGNEVVTPISPTDWKITFNGESVSLSPSIGNWGFKCMSHYWIVNNKVRFSGRLDSKEIEFVRKKDKNVKEKYFSKK